MPARVNQSTLARTLGVSRQAVHDLVQRGILTPDDAKTFDVDEARAIITERVRPSGKAAFAAASALATAGAAAGSETPGAAGSAADPGAQQHSDQAAQRSYFAAKTMREAAEATMAQLKLAEMQRQLIQAEPAISAVYTAFRPLRDQCMLLGRKLAPTVSSMSDRREVQLAIERAMAEIFDTYVHRTLPQLAAQITGSPSAAMPADIAAHAAAAAQPGPTP